MLSMLRGRLMSPSDMKAIVGAMTAIIAFFLIKEFQRKDKIATDLDAFKEKVSSTMKEITTNFANELRLVADRNTAAIEELNKTVAALSVALADNKAWFSGEFVRKADHQRQMDDLHALIKDGCAKAKEDVEHHAKECPGGRLNHGQL